MFDGEQNLDKHMEEYHFIELLNEEDEEDTGDESMDNDDIDTNVDNLNEVSEEDEAMNHVDMTLDFEEKLDINVKNENNLEASKLKKQEKAKLKKLH